MRTFHISKINIQKFRSIKNITLKNLGDVTVFIGPNESGKSNILHALSWFNTQDELSRQDKTIYEDVKDSDTIVTLYFQVLDRENFANLLIEEINQELEEAIRKLTTRDVLDALNGIDTMYLKISKMANGSFEANLLNKDSDSIIEYLKHVLLPLIFQSVDSLFEKFFEKTIVSKLPAGKKFSDADVRAWINTIKSNTYFNKEIQSVNKKIQQIKQQGKKRHRKKDSLTSRRIIANPFADTKHYCE